MNFEMLKPRRLNLGDTLGVFTPSAPGYELCEGLFTNGLRNLEKCGFRIKLGSVTSQRLSQGYRSASPQDRAREFMDLIFDPDVQGLISTIGGSNSSSLIPFLDFAAIRTSRKPICGFSDVTSLHAAILKYSGLRTFYSPSVMCWFGDWPDGIQESTTWFLDALIHHQSGERPIKAPESWSNHERSWKNGDWRNQVRKWERNGGWNVLNPGKVEAPILAFNFNTMMSSAGTKYWPDLAGKILLLEDMEAPHTRTERLLRQLSLIGGFDKIAGLIFSKPEFFDPQGAPFGYEELILEIVSKRDYPIISGFDCGHTVPMITVPQLAPVRLSTLGKSGVEFTFLDGSIWSP